jgi:hypothetical protein
MAIYVCTVVLAVLVGALLVLLADGRARERAWRDIAEQRRYDQETTTPLRRSG